MAGWITASAEIEGVVGGEAGNFLVMRDLVVQC
jgi:hypothetical protein